MSTGQRRPTIRPATGGDLDALQTLARRTIDTCYRRFLGDEAVDWFIHSGASDAHVKSHLERGGVNCLCQDDQIVSISILDGPTIDLMMVDPDHHRRGLGRFLLRQSEETLFAQYPSIRLETFADNAPANSFYQACGWVHGDRMEDEGPAKVEYTKSGTAG
ncbi:GNAT family N-acetyltransferase [Streptomyces sp. NPDC056222]|uniref:GNAT family N-acetyltransferase n=1 Tax=Streptomyces sp. NPDC056222 TaxID=3345749 RepID=UPI0035E3137F